ncbi:hypothetical protein MAFF211271_05860 [Ralstonia syzygii subsp. indonesiensis]|nr:hypothetical protein MAFF211271_05860 [Ralstonia pseudosolanacearum]
MVEGVEQFFYRGTPAVFQTLCEGFSQDCAYSYAAWSRAPRCWSDACWPTLAKADRRVIDARAMPCGDRHVVCEMAMRGGRVMDTIDTSGFARCAACDLRRVDAQIDAHVFVRPSSPSTDTRASRRTRASCVRDVSMRMSKS